MFLPQKRMSWLCALWRQGVGAGAVLVPVLSAGAGARPLMFLLHYRLLNFLILFMFQLLLVFEWLLSGVYAGVVSSSSRKGSHEPSSKS